MRSPFSVAALVVVVVASLSGCALTAHSGSATPTSTPQANATPMRIFNGTPDEWAVVLRGCLEQHGLTTEADPAVPAAFSTNVPDGMTTQQALSIEDSCQKNVGVPPTADFSDSQLKASYQARVDQWTCLVSAGLTSGPVKSFDVFLSDYERGGRKSLWEPTEGLSDVTVNGAPKGPSDVCPRPGTAW